LTELRAANRRACLNACVVDEDLNVPGALEQLGDFGFLSDVALADINDSFDLACRSVEGSPVAADDQDPVTGLREAGSDRATDAFAPTRDDCEAPSHQRLEPLAACAVRFI
jgi:hypothetical protein